MQQLQQNVPPFSLYSDILNGGMGPVFENVSSIWSRVQVIVQKSYRSFSIEDYFTMWIRFADKVLTHPDFIDEKAFIERTKGFREYQIRYKNDPKRIERLAKILRTELLSASSTSLNKATDYQSIIQSCVRILGIKEIEEIPEVKKNNTCNDARG